MKKKYLVSLLLGVICSASFAGNTFTPMGGGGGLAGVNAQIDPTVPVTPVGGNNSSVENTLLTQQMNIVGQIQKLQQNVATLQGVVEIQSHAIQQLQLSLLNIQQALKQQGMNISAENSIAPMPAAKPAAPVATNNATAAAALLPSNPIAQPVKAAATTAPMQAAGAMATAPVNANPPSVNVASKINPAVPVTPAPTATTVPVPAPAPASAIPTSANDQKLYQMAYQQVQNKDYSTAINTFQEYVRNFPQGQYIDKAHYWLGQLYGISGNDQQSIAELTAVVTNYPKSDKAPDAMLQLGMMSYSNGQYTDAIQWFNKLVALYPNTAPGRVAKQQLQQLQKAGY